jgi:hypothetical protein
LQLVAILSRWKAAPSAALHIASKYFEVLNRLARYGVRRSAPLFGSHDNRAPIKGNWNGAPVSIRLKNGWFAFYPGNRG